jgi:hypothetical protein
MNQTYYLDRVVNKLVEETTIEGWIVWVPYSVLHQTLPLPSLFPLPQIPFLSTSFSEFVTNVYGLTEEEVKYVWKQYRYIINSRI